ncbi:hypothetical protein AGMMS50268_38300 [Spirochaetia bacterium]|nr:hypothetical protein AGMMS50268_38300 [Spirochaetia bacterium]
MSNLSRPTFEVRCIVRKNRLIPCLLFLFAGTLGALDDFARGEELFMQNKPREALAFLENTITEDPSHIKACLYLGIAYQQLDMLDEAIAVYRKILPRAGSEAPRVAYNLGNVYFTKGNTVFAEQYYTQAIEADPSFASAYLNRGNTRIRTGALKSAISDYEIFLALEPHSPKRSRVDQVVTFIREEAAAEERRKALAEQIAREEAERRQRMLDEVAASLQSAAEENKGLSAGSEDVLGYDGEFELE